MLDMTMDDKDKEYFITDIEYDDKVIKVTRADGSVSEEKFLEHNLGFYRLQMIKYAKENIEGCLDDIGKDSLLVFVKRYGAIIGGIVGLYFLYNVDIHLIIKIIITILILLGEMAYYVLNSLYLSVVNMEALEVLATEYYLKNLDHFRYYDNENGTDGFIVPPEDIGKYGLTRDMLEQIYNNINEFKKEGYEPKNMSLTYKRRETENDKSMI